MKILIAVIFLGFFISLNAQNLRDSEFERNGSIFGVSIGSSAITIKSPSQMPENEITASFPNLKVGSMISNRSALILYFPGSIYTYSGSGRDRDRGFEAIIPPLQYWMKDRCWVVAGAGIGMDAPAFYDI